MGKHDHHQMHGNSNKTYREERSSLSKRSSLVLAAFRRMGRPAMDREIMVFLGFSDMNAVRPRISELCDGGYLLEIGKAICPTSGKTVRLCSLAERQLRLW
jgi:hypothetical protein